MKGVDAVARILQQEGVEFLFSYPNNNLIDCNTISGNGDGLTNRARVISGTGNTGSNMSGSGTACVR